MELAPRAKRLGAQLIDAALLLLLLWLSALDGVLPRPALVLCACAALALTALQFILLAQRGQTLGKMALGLRIVLKADGENGGFYINVLLRTVVNGLLSLNPLYFVVDSLLIFREDHRCLHDFLAETVVIDADFEPDAPTAA